MKKLLFSAVILFCLIASACLSKSSNLHTKQKKVSVPAHKTDSTNKELLIEVISEKKTTERFEYSAELPTFPGYPELSTLIKNILQKRFAEFNALSAANFTDQEQANRALHSFYMNWEHAELSDKLISIQLETYEYTGGANGGSYIAAVNWLPAENKELAFEDIPAFLGLKYTNAQWLDYLSKNSRETLENKLNREKDPAISQFIIRGTVPEKENFKNITISGKEITLWFQKYQVAPGSEGIISVKINTANIR